MIDKLKLIGVALIVLGMQVAALAYAQGGEQASSPGISGQKPLNLIGMTVAGGGNVQDATDIPIEPRFILEFDKNVVNSLIWGNNSKCFSLTSANNDNIPVSVTKVDDTVDVIQRQNIFVQPVNPLSPGTDYYLKISPALTAKNGVTIGGIKGEGVSIAFRTKGETLEQPLQSDHESTQDHTGTPAAVNSVTSKDLSSQDRQLAAIKQEQSGGKEIGPLPAASMQDLDSKPQAPTGNLAKWGTPIGILLVAGWIVFEIFINRKKKQSQ